MHLQFFSFSFVFNNIIVSFDRLCFVSHVYMFVYVECVPNVTVSWTYVCWVFVDVRTC